MAPSLGDGRRGFVRPRQAAPFDYVVAAALANLPRSFGQLGLDASAANLNIKALKGQPGLYRLRVGDWRAVFVRADQDFLVSAIGLRKDIYERVRRMRLARKGEGLRVIEVAPPLVEASEASGHPVQRRRTAAAGRRGREAGHVPAVVAAKHRRWRSVERSCRRP